MKKQKSHKAQHKPKPELTGAEKTKETKNI